MMPNRKPALIVTACLVLYAFRAPGQDREAGPSDGIGWPAAMARVHARFRGQPGTFAHFGDSITVSMAFWAPLPHERRNGTPALERAYRLVEKYLKPECWREWKGPAFGNDGGRTIRWAEENVDAWLRRLNAEVALILFGTNDLTAMEAVEYRDRLRAVVRRCLDNGTVVILSTIPPRHGLEQKAEAFAAAAREVARELAVPLVDYHAEILKRRPDDWDGSAGAFREFEGYDVPTLIARDGVHPSAPERYRGDYSEQALRCHGYNLRNALVVLTYAEVVEALAVPRTAGLPHRPWFPKAPPLPPPAGEVIRVADVEGLRAAARRVKPNGTILLADGMYPVTETLVIATDRVTLRGESGRRERVVLDGRGTLGEPSRPRLHRRDRRRPDSPERPLERDQATDRNVQRATIRNCVLHNIWQRAVKG
ncbi:MAG: SGNH/GDSL hydrolase family protein [Isosphaeraceae bacterium]